MAEAIVDGIGSGNYAHIDDTNRLYVRTEGINVGSISVGSIIVDAGSQMWIQEVDPNSPDMNNPAWKFEYDAINNIGSVTQFIGAGSFVNVLTWAGYSGTSIGVGSNITSIGSYY